MTTENGKEADERIWNMHERLRLIGAFFVELAVHLFGGTKRASYRATSGDIEHNELDAEIEVKGYSNANPLKISCGQLDNHLELWGFPKNNYIYVIFGYRNRFRKKSKRISRNSETRQALDGLLALNTRDVYVLDIEIVKALCKAAPVYHERGARGEKKEALFRIGTKKLRELSAEPITTLRRLELEPNRFAVNIREITTTFRGLEMKFQSTVIVPRKLSRNSDHLLLPVDREGVFDLASKT